MKTIQRGDFDVYFIQYGLKYLKSILVAKCFAKFYTDINVFKKKLRTHPKKMSIKYYFQVS